MKKNPAENIRPFALSLYLISALLVVIPLTDLTLTFWPFAMGSAEWRYGAIGLLSGFVLTPLIGMTLLVLVAHSIQAVGAIKVAAVVNIMAGAFLTVATAMFLLDALQVRSSVPADARGTFDIGAVKAVLKNVLSGVAFGWMGVVGWRARSHGRSTASSDEGAPLVVG